uniref:Uncharacterized protein n=1 Tax=Odontella aurita TaxID=265563 RepID=A0A7S4IAD1_9STRA|mmetsp:Transcript_2207/g.5882  ORF Transcript_2207/g.5882 Transcript_2207/m.5882 type:complete len:268 (+) Transcript_2207:105-908(+)
MGIMPRSTVLAFLCITCMVTDAFQTPSSPKAAPFTHPNINYEVEESSTRRNILIGALGSAFFPRQSAWASEFTPGGSLVDREVGILVGNPEASPSRKVDNSNVLFSQDNYFKFGQASQWIEPGNVDFPKTMPFTLTQQRYDNLKKYKDRVNRGMATIDGLGDAIKASSDYSAAVADPSDPQYALRPMGLLANGFLASENTGATNELFLARWYINEMYLHIGDIRLAKSEIAAMKSLSGAKKAANSYLGMMNRVITSKVGDKFELLPM